MSVSLLSEDRVLVQGNLDARADHTSVGWTISHYTAWTALMPLFRVRGQYPDTFYD